MKFAILGFTSIPLAHPACSRDGSVKITFYDYPDNDPLSANNAYNCGGHNYVAGGTGIHDDPLTMGSAQGEFSQCEIVYVPYLEKYVRYEDYCAQCTSDYSSGQKHNDIWTGSSTVNDGQEQINCEDSLTPNNEIVIIRSPDSSSAVNAAPLYHKGCIFCSWSLEEGV